ncbi:MAG: ATP-dependent helicase [Acidimicrobiia bacterium]|nr:ATP-dependent helicase [Acidimicrobiia bacterium]
MSDFTPSPEQRAIIDAPLMSVRVAAGAGTGKTTTISQRVRHLVADHGLEPERILGITFTNKATQELADRIRTALSDLVETNREVSVHTYHGFASLLLREFGAVVDVERDTDLITPAFSRQLLVDITHRLAYRHFDPTVRGSIEKLRRLSAQLSDNLVHPASITPPVGFQDDPDSPWHQRLEMLATLVAYDDEKRRLGVADFGDLIRRAHQMVTEHPEIGARVASRYQAVLLDEYQDTDPGQRELLRALFATTTPVMAVGDADQTIYEWRGASKENFERFHEHFAFGGVVDHPLSLNRRSGEAILDVANAIRREIDDRPREPLTAVDGTPRDEVVTAVLPTAVAEADWIAEQIAALTEDGIDHRDIAVLFRKNKDMLLVHDALARHGIPFEVANLGGLLGVPEVADLHAWLRLIDRPEDSVAAARLLLGARFRLGLADLAALNRWILDRRPSIREVGEHDQVLDYTFLEAIDDVETIEALRPEAKEALEQFRSEYRHLLSISQGSALIEVCREILDHTDAWADIEAMPDAPRQSARLNIHRFLDLAEDWSPLEGRPSLTAFLAHLDDLELEGSEELDTARLSESDAVTLITVHRAKGLEFPAVFLPALYHNNFPSRSHGYDNPFKFAHSLPTDLRLDEAFSEHDDPADYEPFIKERHRSQEWRIAYVAATRAKRFLAASHAWWNGVQTTNAKPSQPSELFALIDRFAERVVSTPEPPERPERMVYRSESRPAPDPDFPDGVGSAMRAGIGDPVFIDALAADNGVTGAYDRAVEAFQGMLFDLPTPLTPAAEEAPSTSATGLVTYARCPKQYYWSHVDLLPRRFNHAARRGTEVHRQIELHNLGVVPLTEPEDVADPHDTAEPSGPDPFEVFRRSGYADRTPHLIEAPFDLELDNGMRIRGRIDAVYRDRDRWEIVDFKSGRPKTDPAMDVQLETYAIALDRVGILDDRPTDAVFVYLGGGSLAERRTAVDGTWMASAEQRLHALAERIVAEDFAPAPSSACSRCDFLRHCEAGRRFLESQS